MIPTRLARCTTSVRRAALALLAVPLLLAACTLEDGGFIVTIPTKVRVFNALIDAGAINVTANQTTIATNLPFEGLTSYQSADAGNRQVRMSIAGSTAAFYDQTTFAIDGSADTYVVWGTAASPQVLALSDSTITTRPPGSGQFELRLANAAIESASLDVYVTPPGASIADLSPNFSGVARGGATPFSTFTAATLQVRFTLPDSKSVVYDAGPLTFKERTAYLLVGYARGSGTLVNGALLVNDSTGTGSLANSLLARIKMAHAAPGTAAISTQVDGTPVFTGVPYLVATDYAGLSAGTHTVTAESVTSPGAVIATVRPQFGPATDTSLVVTGFPGAQTAIVFTDTNLAAGTTKARVRFANVSPDAGPIDVRVNAATTVSALAKYAASAYVELNGDTYAMSFSAAGSANVLLTVPAVSVAVGHTYTLYFAGVAGQYATILTQDD